ncbi:hypothetical protein AN643_01475 [Candidatus Epulonipiscioides saccharophilum]|nr:hypothetical protein AN643_01475 [Epulopiscium sp. SCG-B10WGA-EpuloB]
MIDGGSDLKNKWEKNTRSFVCLIDTPTTQIIYHCKKLLSKFKSNNFTPDIVLKYLMSSIMLNENF